MIIAPDKPNDNWSYINWDDPEYIYYDDGTKERLTTKLVVMDFWGKYKGKPLSEIDDIRDLKFIHKVAKEREDIFAEKCANMRLLELK